MLRSLFSSLLLLSVIFSAHGQFRGGQASYLRVYRQTEKLYSSKNSTHITDSVALSGYRQVITYLERNNVNAPCLFDSYLKSGILEMSKGDPKAALVLFWQSIQFVHRSGRLPDSLLFVPYLYAGSCYYDLSDLDSSLYCYKQAEIMIDRFPDLSESERLYNKSGVLYYEVGDYRRSIQYFTKALAIVESRRPSDSYFIVNYQNNIAAAYHKLEEFDRAMNIYTSLIPYDINRNELLHNIGDTYLDAGKPAEAIPYLLQAVKLQKSQAKYNDLALAWLRLKKYDSADYNLGLALTEYKKTGMIQKSQDYSITLKLSGDLMIAKKLPEKALRYYQAAIIQIDRDFKDTSVVRNPQSFYGLHNSFQLFDALAAKARAFQMTATGASGPDALNALETFASALSLARHVERMYYSDEAKLFLVRKVANVYKEAIDLCFRLYGSTKNAAFLEKMFGYMEENKASVLQADLGSPGPGSARGEVRNLLIEEKIQQATVARLNVLLSNTEDSLVFLQTQARIRDLEIGISRLQERLDESPGYYKSKFEARNISITEIRNEIVRDDASLVSYYYSKDKIYCIYITHEQYGCVVIAQSAKLRESILSLRKELNAGGAGDRPKIGEISHYLSGQLIAPVFDKIKSKKHLIVIPNNEISYIPFDMLTDPAGGRILLYDFAISYAYSANFLQRPETPARGKYEVLAMAPFTSQGSPGSVFPVLKTSEWEVRGLDGRILLDDKATKDSFINLLSRYRIIHLATHAVVNDANPMNSFIEFYSRARGVADTNHRLFEQEIYHLPMDSTVLVILSACETGNGVLINGEGIVSLSRAFAHAGCKSVITSLWKADDAATSYILRHLHQHLREGKMKDEALQKARLDYLEDPDIEARYKIPAYWAHLVLIGDFQPVIRKGKQGFWIPLLALAILLITGFAFFRKKRSREQSPAPGPISEDI